MKKLNLKKIITMGLITTSILIVAPVAANAEWRQNNTGWWYSNGSSYAKGWSKINGWWYYFDNNGYMKTGWLYDNGNWYYLKKDGSMVASLYTQVPIEGRNSIFAPDGRWMGYYEDKQSSNTNNNTTNNSSNTSSNVSSLSVMDKINYNYEDKKRLFTNDEYVLSDSEFTQDIAVKIATKNANIVSADGLLHGTLTFGGYNGLPKITKTREYNVSGLTKTYKVWVVGLINDLSGAYLGKMEVFNNGYCVFSKCGSSLMTDEGNTKINEETFDKNNYWYN